MALEITIDGADFENLDGLYSAIYPQLIATQDHNIKENVESLMDVLAGGFGVHEYDDPIKLIWKNSAKSREDMAEKPQPNGPSVFELISSIIGGQDNVELELA